MTLLVLVFGKNTPKSFAISHASRISLASAPVLQLLLRLLLPFIRPIEAVTRRILPKGLGATGGVSEMESRQRA